MSASLMGTMAACGVLLGAVAWSRTADGVAALRARRRLTPGRQPLRPTAGQTVLLAFTICVPALLVLTGPVVTLLVIAVMALGVIVIERERKRKTISRYEQALPFALDEVARGLRTGANFTMALHDAAGVTRGLLGDDLKSISLEIGRGRSLVDALDEWSKRRPLVSVRLCVGAVSLASRTGGTQAQAIDSVAVTLRQTLNTVAVAHSHAAESKMSAALLTFLPIIISGPLLIASSEARHFMFHTGIGQIVLIVGVVLDALGAWWMSVLIRRALS